MEAGQGDSIVLEEEIDPNYEPTEKEVLEYATWLGMDLEAERDLFWIAREGLKAPLPENWKPCKTTDTEEIYYFNFASGQSTWDHPCDEFYRNLYEEHKKKRQTTDVQETDEKKKKVKEDVAELLGRKGSGKKKRGSLAKAEPLGGPSLGKANPLEKKPLPGLSGRLGSLGPSGLGGGGLRPVAGLGPLKSEAKELGGAGIGLVSGGEDFKSDELAKPLSRAPLGTVLGKKPLLSAPSTATADTKSNDALATSEFEGKRERLAKEHAEKLREIQDAHDSELDALRKKLKAQLEDAQDAEEMKLKQLKRELDKKKNEMENQFDREENALQRSRKDQLKSLETEADSALSRKKEELDRDFKAETDKLRLKHEAMQRDLQADLERETEQLTEKMKALFGGKKEAAEHAEELKAEVDRLLGQQERLEQELAASRSESKALVQDKESLAKERDNALRGVDELRQQLTQEKHSESPATSPERCTKCPVLEDRLSSLKREHNEQLEEMRKEIEALQQDRAAAESKEDELIRGQEAALKQEIASLQQQLASLEGESGELKAKCAALERKTDGSPPVPEGNEQLEELQRQLVAAQAELANTEIELTDLQDQHAVILTTNAQVKEQLMKESNEGKILREQLDSKTEAAQQFAAEVDAYKQKLQALQEQVERETRGRQEQERTCDALRKEITALEVARREADGKVNELEKDKSQLTSEAVDDNKDGLRVADLEHEVDRLQHQQRSLEQDLNALRRDKETLLQDKGAAETQHHLVQCEVEELRKKLSELNQPASAVAAPQECSRCPVWEARVSSLESERTEARTEAEKLREELSELKQETRTRAATERESFDAATTALQREKDDASKAFQHQEAVLKQEIAELQQKSNALQAESSDLRAKCDVLQHEKDNAARRESDVSSTASTTQDQLKILERQLAAAQVEATSTKSELQDLQSQHSALLSEHSRVREQLLNEEKEKEGLREQMDTGAKELSQRLASASERHEQQMLSVQKQLESESRSRREREEACDALRKEVQTLEQAKRKADAELGQLESEKRHLESEKSMLALRLDELSMSRKRDEKSVMSVEEALAHKKLEAEQLRASLKVVEADKDHLEARLKALSQDFEQQVAKTHRLEAEYESERARSRTIEKERDTAIQRLQKLADELESDQRKSRALATEVSELRDLLNKTKASEQAASGNTEQATQKIRELEQQKERDEFAMKMKLQQAEVEHENLRHAKERDRMQLQAREKELAAARDEVTRREREIESLQARVKVLLSDKEEVQAALLNANMVNTTRESAKAAGATTDVMLVKLQLADANRNELELHLADISSQLDNATRRCTSLEGRCRDQSVEVESLHVEVASLRSASQKMHMSALESLALVERLEYEHKKRTLRSDFLNQLRGFQEREEQALVRHKARLRAQYERHLEDLVAELEKARQQRVEQEEALSAQILQQIRQERDVKRIEAKRQVREELQQFEQELQERKARDIEIVSKAIEKEEDELGARLREIRQVSREEELTKQLKSPDYEGETEAALSRPAPRSSRRSRPESLDGDDEEERRVPKQSSNALQQSKGLARPARRQKRNMKTYQKWKKRLQEEVALLVNARTLVANQRQGLTKQAHQLKESKSEWKRHSRTSEANPIQREVKRMLDENMANWSEGMRKLRQQEAWVKQREQKLAKMKRTVERLRRKHRDVFELDNNFSGRSESSSDEDEDEGDSRVEWSDYSNQSELTSTLKKLERLEEELASDAGSFSEADDFHAFYQVPPSYAVQREAPYRYPLTSSLGPFAPRRAMHPATELAGPDTRWLRSQRTAFGLRGDRFAVTPVAHSASRTEQVYQQKISRWARGREKVQHAATNHATWLSGLCEEMKEYGAKYSRAEGELDSTVQFVQDEEEG